MAVHIVHGAVCCPRSLSSKPHENRHEAITACSYQLPQALALSLEGLHDCMQSAALQAITCWGFVVKHRAFGQGTETAATPM